MPCDAVLPAPCSGVLSGWPSVPNEVVKDIMAKEGVDESTAQSMLYTGGYTIDVRENLIDRMEVVNPKTLSPVRRRDGEPDAQHRRCLRVRLTPGPPARVEAGMILVEEVTSISDDDVQVYNEDMMHPQYKTRTGDDGTVY